MIQIDDLTDEQCRKLEELGFTVGINAATRVINGAAVYIWYPSSAVSLFKGEEFLAEIVSMNDRGEDPTAFDDPISAAVFLLTCV